MKPNIFAHATKELSQDAFFAWLLEWADYRNQDFDHELHEVAKDFIRFLLDKEDYAITNVEVLKQWQNMDITVTVNNEYFIVIEDKTNTGEHSGQLERYAKIVKSHDKSKNLEPVFIYLKTGNESQYTQQYVKSQGFKPIDRKSVLDVLRRKNVDIKNSIFTDFVAYMNVLEQSTNAFQTLQNITTDWKAAEGFYMLQETKISDAG
ncbi:PD-(D/E)XK nuclease family protein [Dyadobacter koreensis]|uniref:PD-(D/E)XK nuclease family protein n=1 Tax=Dyadobacter koreensis TaxID=408657 RepID=UPI000B888E6C|nr:PD-(D/E)XK nuclease family protein [Dyadobacter koreensis]